MTKVTDDKQSSEAKADEKLEKGMNQKKQVEEPLPSANLMLSVAQKEYEYEVERKNTLENRAGIFLAFVGVVLTFISQTINKDFFDAIPQNQFVVFAVLVACFLIIPLILLLASLYFFVHVIVTKEYTRIELKSFNEERAKLKEETVAFKTMSSYIKVVAINGNKNNKKSKYFNCGVICSSVATFLIIIMYFIASI